jgi:hypothetical protein
MENDNEESKLKVIMTRSRCPPSRCPQEDRC